MKSQSHAIKAIFGRYAPIDEWQFIADASRDLVIRAMDVEGRFVERLTLAITTSAQQAGDLVAAQSGNIDRHWWWEVESVAGSIYGLSARTPAVSSTNGLLLYAKDRLGPSPERESALLRQLVLSASALDGNIVKHNGIEYTVNRKVVELTATGNLLAENASAYNYIIEGQIVLAAGEAADSFYLNDGTINLLGGSSQKLPLSPDGSAGPVGYKFKDLKTGAVNKAIICTLTGGSNVVATFTYIQPTT